MIEVDGSTGSERDLFYLREMLKKRILFRCAFFSISLLIAVDLEVLLPEPLVIGFVNVDLGPIIASRANGHGVRD